MRYEANHFVPFSTVQSLSVRLCIISNFHNFGYMCRETDQERLEKLCNLLVDFILTLVVFYFYAPGHFSFIKFIQRIFFKNSIALHLFFIYFQFCTEKKKFKCHKQYTLGYEDMRTSEFFHFLLLFLYKDLHF
jgi:hypothetical protein